jgi:hypothetical protein
MYRLLIFFLNIDFYFNLLDDTRNTSVRAIQASAFITQENGDSERNTHVARKQSVLDEKALREDDTTLIRDQRIQTMSQNYQVILESIGEDPLRQGDISSLIFISILLFFFHRTTENTKTCC